MLTAFFLCAGVALLWIAAGAAFVHTLEWAFFPEDF